MLCDGAGRDSSSKSEIERRRIRDNFWTTEIRAELKIKFENALRCVMMIFLFSSIFLLFSFPFSRSPEEEDLSFNFLDYLDLRFVALHVFRLLNIRLGKSVKRDLILSNTKMEQMGFCARDVKHFDAKGICQMVSYCFSQIISSQSEMYTYVSIVLSIYKCSKLGFVKSQSNVLDCGTMQVQGILFIFTSFEMC